MHIIYILSAITCALRGATRLEKNVRYSTTNSILVLNISLSVPHVIAIIKIAWTFLSNI